MSLTENKGIIMRFIEEVLNNKDLNVINEIVAEDFLEHVPFPGQGPGRDGLRNVIIAFFTAFPDLHWTIDEQVAEDDNVVTRFTMTGTHQGDFMGIPATGKPINVWGVVMDVVRDGMFCESRIILDFPTLMRQLTS